MEDNLKNQWSEVVFSTPDSTESQRIRRAVARGQLKKIAPRLYTSNLVDAAEDIVRRNCYFILNKLFPSAVISHRSALEGGVTKAGLIILTYKYTKKISLPGLTIRLVEGQGALDSDTVFMDQLSIASRPRALLENLQLSKGLNQKTVSRAKLESILDNICRVYSEEGLNSLREQAKAISKQLGMEEEHQKLSALIGGVLGTREVSLETEAARSRSRGLAFDQYRQELFAHLFAQLTKVIFESRSSNKYDNAVLRNTAFFESYFSNFIEGTEFTIEEAEEIIFQNHILQDRPEDAHDVLSTYKIVSSRDEMLKTPKNDKEFLALLKRRHHILMSARPAASPGAFKEVQNRAGETLFVNPELVKGTLIKGFEFYQRLEVGMPRAIFMMFLVSEVHPFVDGNGRIARIMMNAELEQAEQVRIIIPTVYREDYLLTLRALSRAQQVEGYVKMLRRAQAFTASIDFVNYDVARKQLMKANAFKSPQDGKLDF